MMMIMIRLVEGDNYSDNHDERYGRMTCMMDEEERRERP